MGGSGRVKNGKMVAVWSRRNVDLKREKMVVWVRDQMVRAHGPKDINHHFFELSFVALLLS